MIRRSALLLLAVAARPLAAQAPTPALPDSLNLVTAVRLGRERGVQATLARLNAKVADNRIGLHRADLLPNLAAGASWTRQTINLDEFGFPGVSGVTDPFSIFNFQVRVSQTIFDPAAFSRLRTARDSAVAAGLDAQTAGVMAGATAGLAYLRALSAEETVRAREADSAVAARLLDQARQLLQAGLTPLIDQTRSEVNFAAIQTQLAVARNERDRTRLDLARALDLPPATTFKLSSTLDGGDQGLPTTADDAVRFALEHRTELEAERQRLAVSERAQRAIRAENLPSVGLTGRYQQSGQKLDELAGSYVVQLGITIPIFDGLRRQLRSREQGYRTEAQELRVRDLTNQIDAEARQALLDLASAHNQVTLAQERERLAGQELSQAEERFKAGVAGTIETTNAQQGVLTARDALIQARVNYGIARVNAYRALGILEQLP
jgi:outer membrane protein TolC